MWLNLRKFLILAQISKIRCQITLLRIFSLDMDSAQESNLATLFSDFIKTLSEIRPPLDEHFDILLALIQAKYSLLKSEQGQVNHAFK